MYTDDVWETGQTLWELKPILKDVCPADILPSRIVSRPSAYIVNSDTHQHPGHHWLAFYFPESGPSEFFDSSGQRPDFYHESFKNVLQNIFNNKTLQCSYTKSCGLFALFYLWKRSQGHSMSHIVQRIFSNDLLANEQTVAQILEYTT